MLGDSYKNQVLDNLLTGTLYVGLFTSAPASAGGGTEVAGGSYARQAVTFAAAAGGSKPTDAVAEFPQATTDWGNITHAALFDAAVGGNIVTFGALTAGKTVTTGDIFRFNAGSITHTAE